MTVELLEADLNEIPPSRNGRRPILRDPDAVNLIDVETGRHTLSHTRVAVWLSCHRKFELSYLRRLELIAKPRYFTLGSAYQKAIEYQDPEVGVRFLNGFEPCENCHGTGTLGYVMPVVDGQPTLQPEPDYCPKCEGRGWIGEQLHFTPDAEAVHRVNEAIVRGASKLYLKRWPSRPAEQREYGFRVQLRNPWTGGYSLTYDLLGYADALEAAAPGAGYTWELTENKLVGRVDAADVKSLPLKQQLSFERYGIWRATGGLVGRVFYRWVKKPAIKQRGGRKADKSDAETLEQYCERIEADYEERPDFYAIEEDPQFVTANDMLRIEADLWEVAQTVRDHMHNGPEGRRRVFDRDTSRCGDYGGCHFLPICTGDPDANALYRVRPKRQTLELVSPDTD